MTQKEERFLRKYGSVDNNNDENFIYEQNSENIPEPALMSEDEPMPEWLWKERYEQVQEPEELDMPISNFDPISDEVGFYGIDDIGETE